MSMASVFVQSGIERATTGKCLICENGYSPVGMPEMQKLGIGVWACTCEAGQQLLAKWQVQQVANRQRDLLGTADIPRKYEDWTLESFRPRVTKMVEKVSALREVSAWVEQGPQGPQPWLFLFGPTGRGKTGLGVGALKALIERTGLAGRFISTFDMFDEMKRRFGGDMEAYVDALAKVPLLLVDELVTPFSSAWRTQVLFELVWRRDAAQLCTIWTCAYNPQKSATDPVDDRIVQTVTEAGWRRLRDNALQVKLDGKEIDWGK